MAFRKNDLQKSVERFIADIPVPKREKGAGVITGHVYTDAWEPLQGVQVRASPLEAWRFCEPSVESAPPESVSPRDSVSQWVRRELVREARRHTAISGPDGSFRMNQLPNGEYRLTAFLDGHKIRTVRAYTLRPGGYALFIASRLRSVPVSVRFPDGSQPDSAVIHVNDYSRCRWEKRQGAILLEPGSYRLQACVERKGSFQSPPEYVLVHSDGPLQAVSFLLRERFAIRGRVLFPEREYYEGPCVRWLRMSPEDEVSNARLLAKGTAISLDRAGDMFEIENISPGTYLLGAGLDLNRMDVVELVTVADATVTLDLVLPPLEVQDTPAEECTLEVFIVDDNREAVDGEVVVEFVQSGRYPVVSRCRDGSTFFETLIAGECRATPCIRLDRGGGFWFEPPSEEEKARLYQKAGSVLFRGDTVVTALKPGENKLTLQLPLLSTLALTAPDAEADASVTIRDMGQPSKRRRDRFHDRGVVDEHGSVEFVVVSGRQYAVSLWNPAGPKIMMVHVSGNCELTFAGEAINAIALEADEWYGSLSEAGFERGDVIVGADGKRFKDYGDIEPLGRIHGKRRELDLMVMRGGRLLVITVSAGPMAEFLNHRESAINLVHF